MNIGDLGALKTPLILLVLVTTISAGIVYNLDKSVTVVKRELDQQLAQLREARTRLQKSGEEKEIIVRYLSGYQYLQRIGFIGDEQRLNWLEGLRLSNQQTQLFGVDYQIGAQQPYAYANELNPGQLMLYQSQMKISLNLLHEEDLMRFLGALARQGAGFFSVNQCMVERIGSGGSIRFQPNLHADCELEWITVRPPVAADKKS
jgi:hypothetical protein